MKIRFSVLPFIVLMLLAAMVGLVSLTISEPVYEVAAPKVAAPEPIVRSSLRYAHSRVNVRSGPGTEFSVAKQLERGESVSVTDPVDGWHRVVSSDGLDHVDLYVAARVLHDERPPANVQRETRQQRGSRYSVRLAQNGCPDDSDVRVPSANITVRRSFIWAKERGLSPSAGYHRCMVCYQALLEESARMGIWFGDSPIPGMCSDLVGFYMSNPRAW